LKIEKNDEVGLMRMLKVDSPSKFPPELEAVYLRYKKWYRNSLPESLLTMVCVDTEKAAGRDLLAVQPKPVPQHVESPKKEAKPQLAGAK
jgi:hypothetical protein